MDLAIWLWGGHHHLKNCPAFSNLQAAPKHQRLFCFYSSCSSCFFFFFFPSCFEQGLCYVYVSESEACFLPAKEDWPYGTGQWQNKGYTLYLHQVLTELKTGKRKVDILGRKLKGERNAMFIVALYLVIKEHKICLCFFLKSTLPDYPPPPTFSFSFLWFKWGISITSHPLIHPQPPHLFAPPNLFCLIPFLPLCDVCAGQTWTQA